MRWNEVGPYCQSLRMCVRWAVLVGKVVTQVLQDREGVAVCGVSVGREMLSSMIGEEVDAVVEEEKNIDVNERVQVETRDSRLEKSRDRSWRVVCSTLLGRDH